MQQHRSKGQSSSSSCRRIIGGWNGLRHTRTCHRSAWIILIIAVLSLLVLLCLYTMSVALDTITRLQQEQADLMRQLATASQQYSQLLQAKSSAAVQEGEQFVELIVASWSDKYYNHHYEHYYKHWLAPFRDIPDLKLLEIGADYGRSLSLWSSYFTRPALILGLAYQVDEDKIDELVREHRDRGKLRDVVQVVHGDQSKEDTMVTLRNMGPYHIIVDDGSHVPEHMAFSLFSLWNSVVPGGLFIVEDLECSYWSSGSTIYGYPLIGTGIGTSPKINFVEKMKQLIDTLVKNQIGATKDVLSIMPGDETICSMEFGKNLVVLRKCTEAEMAQAPPLQSAMYDENQMTEWVKNAKSTNPDGFQ